MPLVIYTINIPDRNKRIAFAAEVKKIIPESNTYIPGKRNGIYKSDIGIKCDVTKKELATIKALIDRRGYEFSTYDQTSNKSQNRSN